ncbi:MAG: transaminase [Steroidobacteraceae bacterium]|nr:transaminase [Steroidobacteraceae bacterium]
MAAERGTVNDAAQLQRWIDAERDRFSRVRPRSQSLAQAARSHWLNGVPMHWMQDWGTPFPVFVERAAGAWLEDVDGHRYADFCLGDTGAMFGHSPAPLRAALAQQAAAALTCMLPDERIVAVGARLTELFGLPCWQISQTATDANRAALRWARAATGRDRVLAFAGCYHGTVDETLVELSAGRTAPRRGLIGSPVGNAGSTTLIEFNDLDALASELATGTYACVITEPVMTNIGMVLPQRGFHGALRDLTRRAGTLLLIDETHTLSTGLGGYARVHGLEPDLWVCGKAIAGGFPCAVLGFTAAMEARMQAVLARRADGHSGMGTTLASNALAIACLDAALTALHTPENYERMLTTAGRLAQSLVDTFAKHGLPWTVSRVGARLEFGFGPRAPRNGSESAGQMQPALERAIHLYLLNRGVLLTPFHNMMLCSPATDGEHLARLTAALDTGLDDLKVVLA